MKNLLQWIYRISFLKFIVLYFVTMTCLQILSIAAFYFHIYQIYSLMGKEFSNLGPIATGSWGICLNMFLITPLFVISLILKLIRMRNDKRA